MGIREITEQEFSSFAAEPFIVIIRQNCGGHLLKILISLKLCGVTCVPPNQFWPHHLGALDQDTLNFHPIRLIAFFFFCICFSTRCGQNKIFLSSVCVI